MFFFFYLTVYLGINELMLSHNVTIIINIASNIIRKPIELNVKAKDTVTFHVLFHIAGYQCMFINQDPC